MQVPDGGIPSDGEYGRARLRAAGLGSVRPVAALLPLDSLSVRRTAYIPGRVRDGEVPERGMRSCHAMHGNVRHGDVWRCVVRLSLPWASFEALTYPCPEWGIRHMSRPLFAIESDLLKLSDLLIDADDPTATEYAFAQILPELLAERGAKLDGYIAVIRTLEAEASLAQEEADRFGEAAAKRLKAVATLKKRLADHLRATGESKVKTPVGREVAVQRNGGADPIIVDAGVGIDHVPQRFVKIVTHRELDMPAVRVALESGEQLDFARQGERGYHLRIR